MIKENDFINVIKTKKTDISPQEEWFYRSTFRRMTNAQKKKHDSEYIKEKNSLSFAEWFELITDNIQEGQYYHDLNKNNIALSGVHDKKRHQLNDPEYREYLGLRPLDETEEEKRRADFESNTDFPYPDLSRFNIVEEDENEIPTVEFSEEDLEGLKELDDIMADVPEDEEDFLEEE